jgi:hypothetical protein
MRRKKIKKYNIIMYTMDADLYYEIDVETEDINKTISEILMRGITFGDKNSDITIHVSPFFIAYISSKEIQNESKSPFIADTFSIN